MCLVSTRWPLDRTTRDSQNSAWYPEKRRQTEASVLFCTELEDENCKLKTAQKESVMLEASLLCILGCCAVEACSMLLNNIQWPNERWSDEQAKETQRNRRTVMETHFSDMHFT